MLYYPEWDSKGFIWCRM